MARLIRIFFDGFPEAVDMDRHRGRIAQGIHAPYLVINRFLAEYHIGIDHKKFQYLEFFIGQDFFLISHKYPVCIGVEGNISQSNARLPFQALVLGQLGFDPGHEDAR